MGCCRRRLLPSRLSDRTRRSYPQALRHGTPGASLWRPVRALGHCPETTPGDAKFTYDSGAFQDVCSSHRKLTPLRSTLGQLLPASPDAIAALVHSHCLPSIPYTMHKPAQRSRQRFCHRQIHTAQNKIHNNQAPPPVSQIATNHITQSHLPAGARPLS